MESLHCSLTEVYMEKVKEIETVHNKKVILEEQMEVAISLTPWFKWLALKKCKELAACIVILLVQDTTFLLLCWRRRK